ncbi:nucleotide sugar dehydrogenase [Methylocaldum marinum]|uniref:Nucleotide sugar dehydrogenase n=1 Tax=Methylocaldum marinum TaxID=1432792 RepID=A0A250KT49_9GAMM|nr:nucleotide sugar dehydrogenase [Methylocaldum marinum]BBA34830.1 nucleotide sugar dehydrogenase [Methylocaldum marinum]
MISGFNLFRDIAASAGRTVPHANRPIVCVQGLGFVGAAMAVALANARDARGEPYFDVIGVDLPTPEGLAKIAAINSGTLPIKAADPKFSSALDQAHALGNLIATADPAAYALAETIVIDVHLDVTYREGEPVLKLDNFRSAIKSVGGYMRRGCLVMVETTVPPGTCEKIIAPQLAEALRERGLPENAFLLAHSYERIMPGSDYLDSIVNFWRVYAGYTPEAADACEKFLSKLINTRDYKLTRLSPITSSEVGKVLENSYRAATIAFMDEWSRFAESIGIDLFEVISAIRKRPTHSNMRQPGFGVGGYCLTKDPLLAPLAARHLFDMPNLTFPFCELAVTVNRTMPLASLNKVQQILGGRLSGKSILLLGVSYRQEVGDTRYSPSQIFVEHARARGAKVMCHDPYVDYWPELREQLPSEIPTPEHIDAVVFAVPHRDYRTLDVKTWLNGSQPVILDANDVLNNDQRASALAAGCTLVSTGRGRTL